MGKVHNQHVRNLLDIICSLHIHNKEVSSWLFSRSSQFQCICKMILYIILSLQKHCAFVLSDLYLCVRVCVRVRVREREKERKKERKKERER